jgi:hypothetical protein
VTPPCIIFFQIRKKKKADVTLVCGKAEHLVLSRPFGRRIHETSNSHSAWQSAFESGFDEIGGEECERDRHVDLADAVALALGDAFDSSAFP